MRHVDYWKGITQKWGLPHANILKWLHESFWPNDIDLFISPELLDPQQDPLLNELLKARMIHDLCGSISLPCPRMKDNKCTKNYLRLSEQEA